MPQPAVEKLKLHYLNYDHSDASNMCRSRVLPNHMVYMRGMHALRVSGMRIDIDYDHSVHTNIQCKIFSAVAFLHTVLELSLE